MDAADSYIRHRMVSVAGGTLRLERERLRALVRVLLQIGGPNLSLKHIKIELVRRYQQARIGEVVGPRTVNMEGQLLRSILKHHGQWKLDGLYAPLPEPVSDLGRTLTTEEELELLDTARNQERWFVAYHAIVLESETGMRGVEIRNLQLKRIDLKAGEIHLIKSKTKGGIRTVTLSSDARKSAIALMDRARQVGASAPEHYLIPARVEEVKTALDGKTRRIRGFDPNRPTKGWRSAWRKLTESAGLKGLRGHDLRHNWVTLHAENGTPQSVLTEVRQGSASLRLFERWEGEK